MVVQQVQVEQRRVQVGQLELVVEQELVVVAVVVVQLGSGCL